ncbi:acyltransferase family protein [Pseudomonas sp. 5P_3.1_Bac2]|uniref:acyltransferase family protein n=1 Tax=Pseudomonas sp. 5P_3.1_Bac2 TaxID=2971617 RepID=UPI0021C8E29B|nr:acyltransferase [Pseudomonas sp. 5P_3.1_Bac2]MCU1719256.1 acyltransferase [Pseudomonas sp. 5P_3.1_Bac2]
MKGRISDIEILRGIAVLMVVVHHANGNLFTWSSPALERFYTYFGGWFGVDLFFAISGFVIARDLVPRLQSAQGYQAIKRTVLSFWLRRAWRLLPSAWLWLALILLVTLLFNDSGIFGSLRTNLEATAAGILQFANVRFAQTFMNEPYGTSFVYWSLSLEEQFYLLFPLLILLSRRYLPYVLIGLVLAQVFLVRSPMLMMFRTDALALGVLLALWSHHPSFAKLRPNLLARSGAGLTLLLISLLVMSLLAADRLPGASIKVGLIAILSAVMVWVAAHNRDYLGVKGATGALLRWLGGRSYGIYLIHIPAFFLIREIWFRMQDGQPLDSSQFYPVLISAGLLIVLLCELNYRLVEKPFRLKGKHLADKLLIQPVPLQNALNHEQST